jgi:hypothetical protein
MKVLKTIVGIGVVAAMLALVAPSNAALPTIPPFPTLPTLPPAVPVGPIPQPPNLPNTLDPTTFSDAITAQITALAAAAQLAPQDILNLVLNTYIPTSAEAQQVVTQTVQSYLDSIANGAPFAPGHSGFLGTPEVAVGDIAHSFGFIRTYGGKSGPEASTPRPYPALADAIAKMPQYKVSLSPYIPATPAEPPAAALLVSLLASSTLASTLAAPPVPLPAPIPLALQPKLPLFGVFQHYGGLLTNIQGSGWNQRGPVPAENITSQIGTSLAGAKHTGGNGALIGTNVDTAARPISTNQATLDPWPFYVPLFTSNTNLGSGTSATDPAGAPKDHTLDFLGWKGSVTGGVSCKANGTGAALTADPVPTISGGVKTWPSLVCTSTGAMTGDGIAAFDTLPVDFHRDLAPLWGVAPPSVVAANAAITSAIAAINAFAAPLQTYGLTVALTYLPVILGLPSHLPVTVPTVPSTPTVPSVP